jgi:hypothetical protein
MPADSQAFLTEWKGKDLEGMFRFACSQPPLMLRLGIVENVRDGTSLRVRLLMPDGDHRIVNITLAGVKSPRAAAKPGEASEPLGEEVGSLVALRCINSLCLLINVILSRRRFSLSLVFFNVWFAFKYCHCRTRRPYHSNPVLLLHLCLLASS